MQKKHLHLPVIRLQMINGRIIIFSIRRRSVPGKAKYSICILDRLASRSAMPNMIPRMTAVTVASSKALDLKNFLQFSLEQFSFVHPPIF